MKLLVKRIRTKYFWKKLTLRAVSIPGYGALFTAWALLLGTASIKIFSLFSDVPGPSTSDDYVASRVVEAGWLDVLLLVPITIIAWAGIAFFTGKGLSWIYKKLDAPDRFVPAVTLGLLSLGWIALAVFLAFLFPKADYLVLIASGACLAIGAISFGLEALCIKYFGLSRSDTW